MLGFYFAMAVTGLRRNAALTALMIAAIAVGIGASMTVLVVYRAMAGDPIPGKAHELYAVQIDAWGPDRHTTIYSQSPDGIPDQLTYTDATALMRAHAAKRQAAMYQTSMTVIPANAQLSPFGVKARATYADFFNMFEVPFLYGNPWSATDDDSHAKVAVLSSTLNETLFNGENSIGRYVRFADGVFRVVGVIRDWRPVPRFYDVTAGAYSDTAQVFVPLTTAVDDHLVEQENTNCNKDTGGSLPLKTDCVWIQFWAELPTRQDANAYDGFLRNYALQQQKDGRFHWAARTSLRDVTEWLQYNGVVSGQVKLMLLVSFGFLLVCLVNAAGLMLAKVTEQSGRIATHRAIGADRRAILTQNLAEAAAVGIAGGIAGLLLTYLGLSGAHRLFSANIFGLVRLGASNVGIEISLAIVATLLAALHPTWRAMGVNPASQLKTR